MLSPALLRRLRTNSPSLKDLILGAPEAGDLDQKTLLEMACAFAVNTSVKSLRIENDMFTTDVLFAIGKALQVNSSILSLSSGRLGHVEEVDGVMQVLHEHAFLTSFRLDCWTISDVAGVALAQALQAHASLRSFMFSCQYLNDVTGTALAAALEDNVLLQSFDFFYYQLTTIAAHALASSMLRKLTCENIGPFI